MSALTRQANFLLPGDLIDEMKKAVSKREQSKFVAAALRKELNRLRLEKTLKTSFGAWKDEDHPELKDGTYAYIRNIRKSSRALRTK
jgi:hypothetical protein